MKKVIKILGGIIAFIVVLIIIASIAIIVLVDKKMIETQMRKALHRHVTIEKISVGIFSVVSGIEINNVKISNFMTEKQIEAIKDKPVPAGDLFVGLKALKFKVKFLPLLKKNFVLKEFTLYEPKINIVKGKGGGFNFDDLLKPKKMTEEEKAELEKKKAEEKAEAAKKGPFTADDLPIEITVGKVGIENGILTYSDQALGQTFQAYNLTAKAYSIEIDPKALNKKNSVKIFFETGLKTLDVVKTGGVKTFDIGFKVEGKVIPFNVKTKMVDPDVSMQIKLPYGTITGLQIFEKIIANDLIMKYMGQLSFLKGSIKWKDSKAYVDAHYKSNVVKLSNGNIKNSDVSIAFAGQTNIKSKVINLDLDLIMTEKRSGAIKTGVRKNIESAIKKLGIGKYTKPEKIYNSAVQPLINKDGLVYMRFKATGTLSNPTATLAHPKLSSIDELVKGIAGDAVKDAAGKAAKDGAKKLLKGIKLPKKLF